MDYEKAASYWDEKAKSAVNMGREQILEHSRKFLEEHNTCALATGSGSYVRCTPLEYNFWNDAIWIYSEGGKKFIGLKENKNVSLSVFENYSGFGNLKSIQLMGIAELVEPWSEEYLALLERKKIPVAAMKKLSSPLNLIKIVPTTIDLLDSDFKKDGFDSRQHLEL